MTRTLHMHLFHMRESCATDNGVAGRDVQSEILLKGDNDGDGFETHEMYQSDVHRRNDDAAYWESKNKPKGGFKGTSGFGLGAGNIEKSGAHLSDTVFEGVDATATQAMRARSDI